MISIFRNWFVALKAPSMGGRSKGLPGGVMATDQAIVWYRNMSTSYGLRIWTLLGSIVYSWEHCKLLDDEAE